MQKQFSDFFYIFSIHKIFIQFSGTSKNVDEKISFAPLPLKLGSVYVLEDSKITEKKLRKIL